VRGGLGHALRIAGDSLVAYRLRTFLTALGIIIGVATVIAIEGIIEGLNLAFREQIAVLGTGTLYVSDRPWVILSDWWKYRGRPPLRRADAEWLEGRLERAQAVVPFVHHGTVVQIGDAQLWGIRVIGSTDRWTEMSGIEPLRGRFMTAGELEHARPVAMVGADLVATLREQGVDLGDDIKIGNRRLRVIGEMPARGSTFGVSQDDFVVLPLTTFESFFGKERSVTIGVVVDPEDIERGTDEIIGAMRARRRLAPEAEDDCSVNSPGLLLELYETLTRSLFATAVGLAFITLVVGGVGIMNIMLVAVAERTQEIGIRKALGARPLAILAQFVVEAGLVSGLGGAVGTVLGALSARLVAAVSPLPATVSPSALAFGVAFGVFVGVTFGFLPAWRAAAMTPVDALRAE
jgi:putative ABC transport system permease protein